MCYVKNGGHAIGDLHILLLEMLSISFYVVPCGVITCTQTSISESKDLLLVNGGMKKWNWHSVLANSKIVSRLWMQWLLSFLFGDGNAFVLMFEQMMVEWVVGLPKKFIEHSMSFLNEQRSLFSGGFEPRLCNFFFIESP